MIQFILGFIAGALFAAFLRVILVVGLGGAQDPERDTKPKQRNPGYGNRPVRRIDLD